MEDKQLTEEEVKKRLESCDKDCTDELYSIGLKLLDESLDSFHRLDSKAYAIAGFSGATVSALLAIATFSDRIAVGTIAPIIFLVSAICAVAAGGFSVAAIWPRSAEWFSPDEWLKNELLKDVTRLKQYHILCMYGARQSHRCLGRRKIANIRRALLFLSAAGILLFIAAITTPALLAKLTWLGAPVNALWVAVR